MKDEIVLTTDDELLSAYIDGELPDDAADALTARLASEPQLMQRFEALRGADAAVRDVYAQIEKTAMPASVLDLFDTSQPEARAENVVAFPARGIRRFFEAPVAIAASVALMAGFVIANLLQDALSPVSSNAFVAGAVPAGSGLYELLESTPGGEPLDLSGNMAEVILTFEGPDGDWCRQLRVAGTAHSIHGVACRRDATWQLETIALGEALAPEGQFGTAGGATPDAIEAAVDALIGAGAPLEPDKENTLISIGWEKSTN